MAEATQWKESVRPSDEGVSDEVWTWVGRGGLRYNHNGVNAMTKKRTKQPTDFDAIPEELVERLLGNRSTAEELFGEHGLFQQLKKRLVERALQGELTAHLGYDKYRGRPATSDNARNGTTSKTVKTDDGELEIEVPRDRVGSFEPLLVKKRQTRLTGFDDRVIALYARGMTTRDIQAHLEEIYGVEISPDLISRITDAVREDVIAWQQRPLETMYPVLYLDALVVKVRDQGVVRNKSVYLALAVNMRGEREVLGMWIEQNEGALLWTKILTELKNRGMEDTLIVCCDGLKGFPQAIESVFPKATVQTCIVHMVRHSLRHVGWQHRKQLVKDLRAIYSAVNREGAEVALVAFEEKWGHEYPQIGKSWRTNWERIVPFLEFPLEVRKLVYTTNAIESLNSRVRKLVQYRGHFPSDDAVLKLLYMAISRFHTLWQKRVGSWLMTLKQLTAFFPGRMPEE
jgi:putative transposase